MFRKPSFNLMCIAICVWALIVIVGYHCLFDEGYHPHRAINQTLQSHPRTESQRYVDTILDMTRLMIKIEMWNYGYNHSGVNNLKDLVPESGGTPIRSIVVSTWRSGSSFVGDLINSVPGTFYSYEPLMMFGIKQIRGPPLATRSTSMLKNILKCNFDNKTDLSKYFTHAKRNLKAVNHFSHNKRFWDKCNHKQELCFNADFTAKFCKLFPFQAMKLDRFRLPLAENLLEDKALNVKVVLLVRDPRGVMQSRRHIKSFCSSKKLPDCEEASVVCSDMVTDYKAAANLLHKYPDRLMVLRYEDLAFNLIAKSQQLLKFLHLEPTRTVRNFLRTHSTASNSNHYSTFRITKNIPFKWKKAMKFNAVQEIQEKCREAMSLWGYELAHNASQMASKNFHPLLPYIVKISTQNVTNVTKQLASR